MPILSNQASRFLGGRFAPNKIAGLALWLKADAITGLADGDAISTWTDSSTNGRNATQAGAATLKPLYKTNIINGLPVVRFDGTDDFLALDRTIRWWPNGTVLAVVKATSSVTKVWYAADNNDDPENRILADGKVAFYWAGAYRRQNVDLSISNYAIVSLTLAGTAYAARTNGGNLAAATLSAAAPENNPAASHELGGYLRGNAYAACDVAEFLIYDSALSDANRQAVEVYLSTKYGIALA